MAKEGQIKMGSGIYKMVKGQRVEMSSREVKAYIMKENGWTSSQYDKQYDIFKNKLRAYENYERAHGATSQRQSPTQMLYKEAKAKAREGGDYKPSIKMQRIRSFTSVSSGKAGQRALQGRRYQARRAQLYEEATNKQFKGLIDNNATAKEIAERIKDPVKREQALADYANKIHAKIDEEGKAQENEAIPFGETFGSDDPVDFDIDAYLD